MPPMLVSNVPGTWAHDTMSRRVREEILQRLLEDNQAELEARGMHEALGKLHELIAELEKPQDHILRPLRDSAPDIEGWQAILDSDDVRGKNWLDAPWCVAEFYVYRRVIEALDFFNSQLDPFAAQKLKGLESAYKSIEGLAPKVLGAVSDPPSLETGLRLFTLVSLWGNRMDLSLWPAGSEGNVVDAFAEVLENGGKNLLADDFAELLACAQDAKAAGGRRVDIIVDNAGFELVTDLCLADYLVSSGVASEVVFQLKAHPTFVSDAMERDLQLHVKHMADLDPGAFPGCAALGQRWQGLVDSGAWKMHEDFFWVQPSAFWEMPPHLVDGLTGAALAFTKGDANYRRLLGDRPWALDCPFQEVVSYFPTTICALRTLKAELGCGMSKDMTQRAASEDDQWMVNGKYGVIQVTPAVSPP